VISISDLPTLNASLNGSSAFFLIVGYYFIRQNKITAHKACMLSAFAASILFLISYLIYHYNIGSKPFTGQGWVRPVYFTILITHTILAIVIVPMAIITLSRALKARFDRHKKIARWTLPIWLYVSVTGVTVYLMLYQLY
jgi:uncharacterized membrane protein YozB (DUF420 family)